MTFFRACRAFSGGRSQSEERCCFEFCSMYFVLVLYLVCNLDSKNHVISLILLNSSGVILDIPSVLARICLAFFLVQLFCSPYYLAFDACVRFPLFHLFKFTEKLQQSVGGLKLFVFPT